MLLIRLASHWPFKNRRKQPKYTKNLLIHVLLLLVCKFDQNPPISLVDRMHTRVIFSILYVLNCIRGIQTCGKGLTYWLFLLCFCHFPMWCPGSCVVLDCIDSWSLPPFIIWKAQLLRTTRQREKPPRHVSWHPEIIVQSKTKRAKRP